MPVQGRNFLGLVLQVAVHYHHPLAPAAVETGRNGPVLAEVAAQPQAAHARVAGSEGLNATSGIIRPPVFDKNNLEIIRERFQAGDEAAHQFLHKIPSPVHRAYDGNAGD